MFNRCWDLAKLYLGPTLIRKLTSLSTNSQRIRITCSYEISTARGALSYMKRTEHGRVEAITKLLASNKYADPESNEQ
jgi:hypothetical protein